MAMVQKILQITKKELDFLQISSILYTTGKEI